MSGTLDGVLRRGKSTSVEDNSDASCVGAGSHTDFPNDSCTLGWGVHQNVYVAASSTALYALILVLGLVGNVSTCVVITRNRFMHTATNYYLFSLAVSGSLLLVCRLPQETYHAWPQLPNVFGDAWCVLGGLAAETYTNATVLTITAFTVERYLAICHPFQAHAMSQLSQVVKLVLAIWLLSLGLAAPQAAQLGVVPVARTLGLTACTIDHVVFPHSVEVATVMFFVAPMTVIAVLYVLIVLRLRSARIRPRGGCGRCLLRVLYAISDSAPCGRLCGPRTGTPGGSTRHHYPHLGCPLLPLSNHQSTAVSSNVQKIQKSIPTRWRPPPTQDACAPISSSSP